MSADPAVPVLVVTGPVGVGKTSVATAVSDLLSEREMPHALVDMDGLRSCYPSPEGDPFNIALAMRNLTAVWFNYREAGAARLVLADVVESQREITGYREAIPDGDVRIVRLTASISTIHARLEGRETAENLEWYRHRAVELSEQMDRAALEDARVDTEGKTLRRIAGEILEWAGWLSA